MMSLGKGDIGKFSIYPSRHFEVLKRGIFFYFFQSRGWPGSKFFIFITRSGETSWLVLILLTWTFPVLM